jgi:hypothetical protein
MREKNWEGRKRDRDRHWGGRMTKMEVMDVIYDLTLKVIFQHGTTLM